MSSTAVVGAAVVGLAVVGLVESSVPARDIMIAVTTGNEHWAVATTADRWAVTTGAQ